MSFQLTSKDYIEYIKRVYQVIHGQKDYITDLDSATGDGDHWANINMGFEKLAALSDDLEKLNISDALKEIGKSMMAVIGGSSGVLYGSAYLGAAKVMKGKEYIEYQTLYEMLKAMLEAIMSRGNAQRGFKTMVDSLALAVDCYEKCLTDGIDQAAALKAVKQAAIDGAESTRAMEAVRGRATYQANKGVGHLDPGAVTMSYQIAELMDYILEKL